MQLFANFAYCDENSYCYIHNNFRFLISWFLSEFIVLKVEIENRNMGLALLRKIHGSDGKNIDFRFNYTPECMVSSMHF